MVGSADLSMRFLKFFRLNSIISYFEWSYFNLIRFNLKINKVIKLNVLTFIVGFNCFILIRIGRHLAIKYGAT